MEEEFSVFKVVGVIALVATFIGLLVFWFGFVDAVTPGPGQQAVLIYKPRFFGRNGVDPNPVNTGRIYVVSTTEAVYVNMQPEQQSVAFNDLMSSDGVPLHFDSVIRYKVNDSVKLIQNFGTGWYKNNLESEFMNRVRQAVRKHGMNETALSSVAIDQIDAEVFTALQEYVTSSGLPITLIAVTIGKANPPDSVKNQRIETAAQQQRIQTEQNRKLAEDARKAAETSRAEADNAYKNAIGMSTEQFLALEQIKASKEIAANIANSGKATIIMNGVPGSSSPLILSPK